MNSPGQTERRRSPRHQGLACEWLSQARLRHGLELLVVNLAREGACVEAPARLLPGSSVELHLAAPGWQWTAGARVLRCHVAALLPEHGVRYRAALQFERQLTPPARWNAEDGACMRAGRAPEAVAPRGARPMGAGSCYSID